jgi:hypothetical protein
MKKIFLLLVSITAFCSIGKTQVVNSIDNAPKQTFEITINGKKYQIAENEELKLDSTLTKPTISIKVSDYKKFNNGSVAFKYPAHFSYEYSQDTGYRNWTLNGNEFVVMLFELDGDASLTSLTDEVVRKFGPSHCTVVDSKKELGHKIWNSKKIKVTLAGENLTQEYFEIKLNDSESRFICFQDSSEDDGSNSKEYLQAFNLINSTITFVSTKK